MGFLDIILIAVGLAMDAFAVSLAAGTSGYLIGPRPVFRISFHFGFFQFLMTVLGWFTGYQIAHFITTVDHWVAFALLAFVGIRMIRSGLRKVSEKVTPDPSRGMTLVMLSIATSLDAFAIGFSLAMLNIKIWYPSVMIGWITGGLSWLGIWFGNKLGDEFGRRMEIFGGAILLIIGLRILIAHLH